MRAHAQAGAGNKCKTVCALRVGMKLHRVVARKLQL